MSRRWPNARGSGWVSSAMSILVILGTSAAMARSNATSPPDRAGAGIRAGVESGDGATPVTTIELGGDASGPTESGPTASGSATSPAHRPSRTTTASCGGTVSSVGRNLLPTSGQAGISVAISRVRANCAREPQASGLLRALERLADHGRPSSPGHSAGGSRSTPPGANSHGHGNGHAAGRGNGHAGAGNPGKGGHPNHQNSTTTGNAGGGGKGKGAGREDG